MIPKVGVVIPVHNGARFIDATLSSVANQNTHVAFDVVCVDDGSTDDSVNHIRAFSGEIFALRIICHPEAFGPAAARNEGAGALDTEYIAFLDQDDIWHPEKTSLQLTELENNPEFEFCIGLQEFRLDSEHNTPPWFRDEWKAHAQQGFLPSALMTRRSFFSSTGGFDTQYRFGGDDVDWFARNLKAGVAYGILDQTVVTRLVHQSNLSRHSKNANTELLTIVKNHLKDHSA